MKYAPQYLHGCTSTDRSGLSVVNYFLSGFASIILGPQEASKRSQKKRLHKEGTMLGGAYNTERKLKYAERIA